MTLPTQLLKQAEAKGFTLETLSEKTGIPVSTLSKILRGESPFWQRLQALAAALDVVLVAETQADRDARALMQQELLVCQAQKAILESIVNQLTIGLPPEIYEALNQLQTLKDDDTSNP